MAEGEQFVYTDVPVRTQVHSENVSPEYLSGVAHEIFGKIQASGVRDDDAPGNAKLLERLQGEYRDFTISFPLVLRWMVQMRQYRQKAFNAYLGMYAKAMQEGLATRQAYTEMQVEYLVLLQKEIEANQHHNAAYWQRYRRTLVDALNEEAAEFEEMQKQAQREIEQQDAAGDLDLRQTVYAQLMQAKVDREKAEEERRASLIASPPNAGGGMKVDPRLEDSVD